MSFLSFRRSRRIRSVKLSTGGAPLYTVGDTYSYQPQLYAADVHTTIASITPKGNGCELWLADGHRVNLPFVESVEYES